MNKSKKTSLKLPIFLIIGPAVVFILALILGAIVNSTMQNFEDLTTDSDPYSTHQYSLPLEHSDGMSLRTWFNLILFAICSMSILAFVPCLVFGIIILKKRRSIQLGELQKAKVRKSKDSNNLE